MSTPGDTTLMIRRGDGWRPMAVQPYENEEELQRLLHAEPSLLPGVSTEAIAAREVEVPNVGFVDLVVLDLDGSVTLVECKLNENPEIRRKVVGQLLAYASGLWRLPYPEFEAIFNRAAGSTSIDAMFLAGREAESDGSTISAQIAHALTNGRFRLCIAVDGITDELRNTVEYLNTHSTQGIEVVLFEVGIVTDGDVQVLVPRTFGGESARLKSVASGEARRKWTFDDVVAEVDRVSGAEAAAAVGRVRDFFTGVGWPGYPGKGASPTWSLYARIDGVGKALVTVYPYESGKWERSIALNLGSLAGLVPQDRLTALSQALHAVPALQRPLAGITGIEADSFPIIPLSTLAAPGVTDAVTTALRTHLVETNAPQ